MSKEIWNRLWAGILASVMLCLSILLIGTGRIIYGPDAFLVAIMGWMFIQSLYCILSVIVYFLSSSQSNTSAEEKK